MSKPLPATSRFIQLTTIGAQVKVDLVPLAVHGTASYVEAGSLEPTCDGSS